MFHALELNLNTAHVFSIHPGNLMKTTKKSDRGSVVSKIRMFGVQFWGVVKKKLSSEGKGPTKKHPLSECLQLSLKGNVNPPCLLSIMGSPFVLFSQSRNH